MYSYTYGEQEETGQGERLSHLLGVDGYYSIRITLLDNLVQFGCPRFERTSRLATDAWKWISQTIRAGTASLMREASLCLCAYHASMIRESLVPSAIAAVATTFSVSVFLGAFVFFTAGVSAFADAAAAFLLGAIVEKAPGRAVPALSCNRAENG